MIALCSIKHGHDDSKRIQMFWDETTKQVKAFVDGKFDHVLDIDRGIQSPIAARSYLACAYAAEIWDLQFLYV